LSKTWRSILGLETKNVLITVKAPPNPSKKHQETNCCAGIELSTAKWIRLYPIPFRLLEDNKKFPKYSIITVNCERPLRDKRVESYKIDHDSITIQRLIDTSKQWEERKEIVLPTLSPSFCAIFEEIRNNKSLGVFKPIDIEFDFKKSIGQDENKRQAAYNQYRLFERKLKPIEQIPFSFYYKFRCHNSPDCCGHKLMIHDWELNESYRRWRIKYKEEKLLLDKIKQKWFSDICGPKKDVYFYVGNVWRRPKQFMVLGVFYPPKAAPTLFTR
jgi:hypothetical protein